MTHFPHLLVQIRRGGKLYANTIYVVEFSQFYKKMIIQNSSRFALFSDFRGALSVCTSR